MALDGEYRRLLDRDTNPFAFLYQGVYLVTAFTHVFFKQVIRLSPRVGNLHINLPLREA